MYAFPWTEIFSILFHLSFMFKMWSCCRVTAEAICHVTTEIYLVNWTLLYRDAIQQYSRIWPFCYMCGHCADCHLLSLASWWGSETAALYSQGHWLTCSMCLVSLCSNRMCMKQIAHNCPLTQCVTDTSIYLDFCVLVYSYVVLGVWISIQI
jgi:hypothetical protein